MCPVGYGMNKGQGQGQVVNVLCALLYTGLHGEAGVQRVEV